MKANGCVLGIDSNLSCLNTLTNSR
jgi:hypothetical protein